MDDEIEVEPWRVHGDEDIPEDVIPFEVMESARLLMRNGRAWLSLTTADIERGAIAIVRDPHYRDEIALCAHRHAEEVGDPVLLAMVREAWDRLDTRDGGSRRCSCRVRSKD